MDESIWCLKIVLDGGTSTEVFGPHDDLRIAFEAFSSQDWATPKVVVTGICNTADHATLHVVVKLENVMAMLLFHEM